MNLKQPLFTLLYLGVLTTNLFFLACKNEYENDNGAIRVVGAMKDAMWKGEIDGKIDLDTLSKKENLYGLGPLAYFTGEILINNGIAYSSRVLTDSSMAISKSFEIKAPFFVYAYVDDWYPYKIPDSVQYLHHLEKLIAHLASECKNPFAFKLEGKVNNARIHVQNLPPGTTVSSPAEAHQGQTSYELSHQDVRIIGFYSRNHKGVFTHHDTHIHAHLITKNGDKMGHLDSIVLSRTFTLYLPFQADK